MNETERRGGYVDIERMVSELAELVKEHERQMHKHDCEIAVLREQAKSGFDRINSIEMAVREIHEKIDEISEYFARKLDSLVSALAAHTLQENKDRVKLLLAIVATLFTGLASLFFEVVKRG